AGFLFANQVPRRNQHFVMGLSQVAGFDEVRPLIHLPKGLVVAAERLKGSIFFTRHRVSQDGVVLIGEEGDLRFWPVVLQNIPMSLDQAIIPRCFANPFRLGAVAVYQTESHGLAAGGFGMVSPIDNSLGAGSDAQPIPQADVAGPHVRALLESAAAVPALEFRQPKRFAGGIRTRRLNPGSATVGRDVAPTGEIGEPPGL